MPHLLECGLQNEKYIYLDFAWIPRLGCWIASWVVVGSFEGGEGACGSEAG